MTIGRKLTLGFGAAMALVLGLGLSSLSSIGTLSDELHTAVGKTARKSEMVGEVKEAITAMRAGQRGVVLFSMLKNASKVEQSKASFSAAEAKIESLVSLTRPLLVTETGRQALNTLQSRLTAWQPIYREIVEASAAQRFDEALTASLDRSISLATEMQAAGDTLLEIQRNLLAESLRNAGEVSSRSRWLALVLIGLSLAVGGVVLWVVGDVNRSLRRLAGEMKEGAGQVASAASQVSTSSQSLAQGASEQAASLEETSASSQEINSMAHKNTENSSTAADLVTRSQQKFSDANRALEEMVAAMGEIHNSSGKISRIIKVIDEIAFQTNILALNAAVEAARAGEAGLGFAVVADEVRNLAQRSAQAAKDTAALIEESIAKSGEGQGKVDQVAQAIRAVAEESGQIKTLVEEVHVGSIEQARGIDQIGKAIAQMEHVTQTSAAGAEEGAAAAEELTSQAEMLRRVAEHLSAMVGGGEGGEFRTPARASRLQAARAAHSRELAGVGAARSDPKALPMEDHGADF